MNQSYITSSYNKLGGINPKKKTSPLGMAGSAIPASPDTSYRDISYREPSRREPIGRSPLEQKDNMGRGRIEGPSIEIGGSDDPWSKFRKEQEDIQKQIWMNRVNEITKNPEKYLKEYESELRRSVGQNEQTIARNLESTREALKQYKEGQRSLMGRQGHSSPNDTRNRYQR